MIEITIGNLTLQDLVDYVFDPEITEDEFCRRCKWYEETFGLPIISLEQRWLDEDDTHYQVLLSQHPA